MPLLSTPRNAAALISIFPSLVPTRASGAFMPARTLGAPQTTFSWSRLVDPLVDFYHRVLAWRRSSRGAERAHPAGP